MNTAGCSTDSLRRSVHNQLVHQRQLCSNSSYTGVALELRNTDLMSRWATVLQYCGNSLLCTLDLSYSRLNRDTIVEICKVSSLRTLRLVACRISDLHPDLVWPQRLEQLDLARNELTQLPPGIMKLKHLRTLNLSGNRISKLDAGILMLPHLSALHLVRNPIVNVPAPVRLGSVAEMRRFLGVSCSALEEGTCLDHHRDSQARHSESESGYESVDSITLSRNNIESATPSCVVPIPCGYAPFVEHSGCAVCLPTNHFPQAPVTCTVDIVNDVSLYPPLKQRAVLITPVIKVNPHGLSFPDDSPAILILPHCLPPTNISNSAPCLVPMCSNTGPHLATHWEPLPLRGHKCHTYQNYVILTTTHFSMFAVILICPYPNTEATIFPEEGGVLQTPELPGFVVRFPPHALHSTTTVKATVYYADEPYHIRDDVAGTLASACIGLEPHGALFHHPVKVSLPVLGCPDEVSGALLRVWCAPFNPERADMEWSELNSIQVTVDETPAGLVATFALKHFSFFKLLWRYCQDTVVRIKDGALFAYRGLTNCTLNMFCEVFLSPPLLDQTCGIILVAYKFGNPLPPISNYPLKVGESGSIPLTVGRIEVAVRGKLSPQVGYNDTLVRTIIFSGNDFSVQFLLQLTSELQSYRSFGIIQLSCSAASPGVSPCQINLIAVSD